VLVSWSVPAFGTKELVKIAAPVAEGSVAVMFVLVLEAATNLPEE
jgi:hypothetical protein